MPKPYSIQTLVRILYTDGKVATMVINPHELDTASPLPSTHQADIIMRAQVKTLAKHMNDVKMDAIYESATNPRAGERQAVHDRADMAHKLNRSKGKTMAEDEAALPTGPAGDCDQEPCCEKPDACENENPEPAPVDAPPVDSGCCGDKDDEGCKSADS